MQETNFINTSSPILQDRLLSVDHVDEKQTVHTETLIVVQLRHFSSFSLTAYCSLDGVIGQVIDLEIG